MASPHTSQGAGSLANTDPLEKAESTLSKCNILMNSAQLLNQLDPSDQEYMKVDDARQRYVEIHHNLKVLACITRRLYFYFRLQEAIDSYKLWLDADTNGDAEDEVESTPVEVNSELEGSRPSRWKSASWLMRRVFRLDRRKPDATSQKDISPFEIARQEMMDAQGLVGIEMVFATVCPTFFKKKSSSY